MKGRISQKTIDDLIQKSDLAEIISDATTLKAHGHSLTGLCPFHEEKTPSFTVSPDKGVYYCFGCHAHGNVYTFMKEYHQMSFVEAVHAIADRYNVPVELETPADQADYDRSRIARRQLNDVLSDAVEFYQRCLPQNPAALHYLTHDRQIPNDIIARFQIGYAPAGWDALSTYLDRRGFSREAMLNAGLVKESDRGGVYDRFRDRIIFPICDATGKPIALGGRAMNPTEKAKYLNSPETEVFSKSKVLFGLHHARKAIASEDHAILVEGYMDVVALHSHGIENVAAVLGTAINDRHISTLSRYSQSTRVIVNFDGDNAGIAAAKKATEAIADTSIPLTVLTLPNGNDPDDFLKAHGVSLYRQLLDNAPFWVDWRLDLITAGRSLSTSYAQIAAGFLEFLPTLTPVLRSHYSLNCAMRLANGNKEQASQIARSIAAELNKGLIELKDGGTLAPKIGEFPVPLTARAIAEVAILRLYVSNPLLRDDIGRAVSHLNNLGLEPNAAFLNHWDLWKALRDSGDPQIVIQERPELIPQFLMLHAPISDEDGMKRLRGAMATIEREIRRSYCEHLLAQISDLDDNALARCQREIDVERSKIRALDRIRADLH